MEIQLKLYGSSKILSDKDTLNIQLPNNSNGFGVKSIKSLCFNILDILSIKMYIYS